VKQISAKQYPEAAGTGLFGAAQLAAVGLAHPATALGGIHPDAAPGIVADTHEFGGSTRHLGTGESMIGTPHTAGTFASELAVTHPQADFHPGIVEEYANRPEIARLRAASPNVTVGTETFTAPDGTKMVRMEPSHFGRNQHAAAQMSSPEMSNQRANFSLRGGGKELPTGGSGEPNPNHPMPDPLDRVKWLESQQPQTQSRSFDHYGKKVPDDGLGNVELDGAKRGSGDVEGQERARLDVSPKAPPGIYVYESGTRAEPKIASGRTKYLIRGKFAMADMADPKIEEQRQQAIQQAGGDQASGHKAQ